MFHSFNSIHTQPRTGSRCRADSAIALSSWCPTFRQSAADRVSEKTWRSLRSSCVCASRSLRCGATSAPAPRARRFPEAPFCLRRYRTGSKVSSAAAVPAPAPQSVVHGLFFAVLSNNTQKNIQSFGVRTPSYNQRVLEETKRWNCGICRGWSIRLFRSSPHHRFELPRRKGRLEGPWPAFE